MRGTSPPERRYISRESFQKGVRYMKKKIIQCLSNKKVISGCAAIALAAVIGGVSLFSGFGSEPEFPSYTDPVMETSIDEEETPLASQPSVSTTTEKKTKTTKKKVKLKKASKKTYTKKLKPTTKVTNSTSTQTNSKVSTKKTVVTNKTEKYTKKSKTKLVTTKTTTTIETTTTQMVSIASENAQSAAASTSGTSAKAVSTSTASAGTSTAQGKYEANVATIASHMDSRVLSAFQQLGFTVTVDPSVGYSGYFNARNRSITLRKADNSVYHELGHFLAFIAGNVDKTSAFQSVYEAEKANVTSMNKAYITQNASEYFAESVRDFILNNASLKSTRPQTYAAVQSALETITDARIAKIQQVYGPFWS